MQCICMHACTLSIMHMHAILCMIRLWLAALIELMLDSNLPHRPLLLLQRCPCNWQTNHRFDMIAKLNLAPTSAHLQSHKPTRRAGKQSLPAKDAEPSITRLGLLMSGLEWKYRHGMSILMLANVSEGDFRQTGILAMWFFSRTQRISLRNISTTSIYYCTKFDILIENYIINNK
jgi:hypothetical protein